jgi:hypothetical protein
MEQSPGMRANALLLEAMRAQMESRRRLRELQALTRPTDDEREEAWLLLRSIRTLAAKARQLRLEEAKVRLGALEMPRPSTRSARDVSNKRAGKSRTEYPHGVVQSGAAIEPDQL